MEVTIIVNELVLPTSSGIYKITCTFNKKIYIGSAVNLQQRQREHLCALRQNKHHSHYLQRAWNKYGEQAFIFEVLELVLPIYLIAREQYWFNKLKPFGRKGYNLAPNAGSTLGVKHTSKARENMSRAHIGKKQSPEVIEKRIAPLRGRKRSPEVIEKSRQGNLGKKLSPEQREQQINRLRRAHTGKKLSPEHIEKLKGRRNTPEHIEKIRQSKLGKPRSLETREKLRQAQLAYLAKKREKDINNGKSEN